MGGVPVQAAAYETEKRWAWSSLLFAALLLMESTKCKKALFSFSILMLLLFFYVSKKSK